MPTRIIESNQRGTSEPSSEGDHPTASASRDVRQRPRPIFNFPYPPPFNNIAQAVRDVVDRAPVASDNEADDPGLVRAAQLRSLARRRE